MSVEICVQGINSESVVAKSCEEARKDWVDQERDILIELLPMLEDERGGVKRAYFRWLGANVAWLMGTLAALWWPMPTAALPSPALTVALVGYGILGCYLFLALAGNSQRLARLGAKIHELQLRVRNMRRVAYGEANVD